MGVGYDWDDAGWDGLIISVESEWDDAGWDGLIISVDNEREWDMTGMTRDGMTLLLV